MSISTNNLSQTLTSGFKTGSVNNFQIGYIVYTSNSLASYTSNNSNFFSNLSFSNSNNLARFISTNSSSSFTDSNNLATFISNTSNILSNLSSINSLTNSNNLVSYILNNSNNSFIDSNNLALYNLNTSNSLNNKFNSINTDTIIQGTNNRFIINDIYNRNISFTNNLFSSNIITSNLSVIGDSTTLNTTIYQTEQLQVVNDTTATAMIVKQMQFNKNVAEFYHQNSNLTLILNSNGNIGIGITNPLYKLELSTSTNPIRISNSSTTANNAIQIQNNSTFIANIGVGGTAIAGNYQNNLFLESSSGAIILNSSGKTSITSPSMIIGANSYIGIGTNPTVPLTLGNFTGNKIISLYDNGLTNNFQFIGLGANNGLCLNTFSTTDAFQFRVGTSTTAANELMRINGNGSVCIGTTSATSANTKLTISGSSSGYSQPLVNITQNAGWDGNYALQVTGYTNLGGFRINGADAGNSITHTTLNANMGFSLSPSNTSGNITFTTFGGSGNIIFYTQGTNERARIDANGLFTTVGNIDCGGGIALTGSTSFFSTSGIDSGNLTNTFINFKHAGTGNDWCYLRQIGGDNAYKLAFDFHDDTDANFCIRSITSTATPDTVIECFTVNNGTVSCTGDINCSGNITAYYSDIRLKDIHSNIQNPLDIVNNLTGFYYTPNELAKSLGVTKNKMEIGLSAQDVQNVLPELVSLAPFDMEDGKSKSGNDYLTVSYERLVPVLIEAIKEQNKRIENLENKLNSLL
jgi:hypothetical protein